MCKGNTLKKSNIEGKTMLIKTKDRQEQQSYQPACKNQVLACMSGVPGISVYIQFSDWLFD